MRRCLMGTGFQLGKVKNVLEMAAQQNELLMPLINI